MGSRTDFQAFCDFCHLSHHIQSLRVAVHLVMIFPHEQLVGAHMEAAGHGNPPKSFTLQCKMHII